MVDRTSAATSIREAGNRFVAECELATDSQWLFRPTSEAWSMAYVVEHVVLSNVRLNKMLVEQLLNGPLAGRSPDVIDVEIPYLFYRGEEPPNISRPTGELRDRRHALHTLRESLDAIATWAESISDDLRGVGCAHFRFGMLDGVQWLQFVAAHTERHRSQVIGLKLSANFPG